MRRIGDRQFLFAWQAIRAATQPHAEAMAWDIDGVSCRRHRHSLGCPDHLLSVDAYHVGRFEGRGRWRVLICTENWWDETRKAIRHQAWATLLYGSRQDVMGWFKDSAKRHERPVGSVAGGR